VKLFLVRHKTMKSALMVATMLFTLEKETIGLLQLKPEY